MKAVWKGIGQYLNIVHSDGTSQDCTCSYSEYMITAIGRVQ